METGEESYLPPNNLERDGLIEAYFHLGLQYLEIVGFLGLVHGFFLSIRQLKRILKQRNLRRRGQRSSGEDIVAAIECELRESGCLVGYRLMHQRLVLDYGISVGRETTRQVLKALDPDGVERRSRHRLSRREYYAKGPDYIWHCDGYDKLKPFGFCNTAQ